MNNFPSDDCENRFDAFDAFLWHGEIVFRERHQIGQLALRNRPLLPTFASPAIGVGHAEEHLWLRIDEHNRRILRRVELMVVWHIFPFPLLWLC